MNQQNTGKYKPGTPLNASVKTKAKDGNTVFSRFNRNKEVRQPYISLDPFKAPSPSPMKWKADGVDHINLGRAATTELGQALEHSSPLSFVHSIFGNFSNMESFWYYIRSEERDDRIRNLSGPALNYFIRQLTLSRVTNFRAIIMDSNYQRIMQYDELVNSIVDSTLPFECYVVNDSGIRIRPDYFNWFLYGFEEIRNSIKEKRQPDFKLLLNVEGSSIYQFVIPDSNGVIEQSPHAAQGNRRT